jgi:NADH dehydrogenase [ubiquinone] 1 alpha subcomplex assembly factor 1
MSDADAGGFSKAELSYVPSTPSSPSHALFHGSISTALPRAPSKLPISGYAGFRTRDRQAHLFGKGFWNLDPYMYIALRVKSDGRAYLVNVQTDSIEVTDLHQHRLYTRTPGEWETVLININEFVRTNDGRLVDPQTDMMRERVNSVGVSLTDRRPGKFELCVERIWATNGLEEEKRGSKPKGIFEVESREDEGEKAVRS